VLSHTGRIRLFKQASLDLLNTYLAQLLARAGSSLGRPRLTSG
jgi:hypothetical protein